MCSLCASSSSRYVRFPISEVIYQLWQVSKAQKDSIKRKKEVATSKAFESLNYVHVFTLQGILINGSGMSLPQQSNECYFLKLWVVGDSNFHYPSVYRNAQEVFWEASVGWWNDHEWCTQGSSPSQTLKLVGCCPNSWASLDASSARCIIADKIITVVCVKWHHVEP